MTFKVGDTVEFIVDTFDPEIPKGTIGRVVAVSDTDLFPVEVNFGHGESLDPFPCSLSEIVRVTTDA
ncbi:hypothetical protein ACQPZJ_35670 [Actinoplanes sp. CA-054009]